MISEYYAWLSSLANLLTPPISDLADQINLPLISVLLFGLIGAAAPCQLSTNVAALAFLSRDTSNTQRLWSQTLAFVAGKVTVYLLMGGLLVLLGLQLSQFTQTAISVAVIARKALGPLLIVAGLVLLGLLRTRLSFGGGLTMWLEERAGQGRGLLPAYLLGIAFSFTFCPTLFWLFFGLTIPLALSSSGGVLFPGIFAVGTALPLLFFAGLIAYSSSGFSRTLARMRRVNAWAQKLVGIIFILVGIHEIVLYWLL